MEILSKMELKMKEKLFSEIYTEYKHRIYRICFAYIYQKEDVDDLFQEILANIWNSLDNFRGESQAGTWVYRVAVNSALLYNRQRKSLKRISLHESDFHLMSDDSGLEEQMEKEKKLTILAKCISQLEKQDRLIISLILEGLSYEKISEIVGIKPNHVGVKVNRIKKQLFTLINQQSHE